MGTGPTAVDGSYNSSQMDGQTIESLMKPNIRRADRLAWVMSDKGGLRQQLLQDLQFRTVHFHHDLHSRAQAQRMLNELCLQSPDLLWVRLAGPCAGSGNKMDALRAEHLCRLINQQSCDGRLVVVEANERSQVWNLQAMRECMSSLQMTLHQMCNYENLKHADDAPCCSRLKLLTNFQIQDKGACLCGNTATHMHQNDLGKRQYGRFSSAMQQLMRDVLTVGVSEVAILGTQPGDRQPEFDGSIRDFGDDRKRHVRFSSLHVNEKVVSTNQAETSAVTSGHQLTPKMHIDLIKATKEVERDYWLSGGPNALIRVHTAPRVELCDPQLLECPIALNQLSGKRQTHLCLMSELDDGSHSNQVICDDWRNDSHDKAANKWTGITVFEIEAHNVQSSYPTTGALRQKQKKLEGHVVKPKFKHVEQHADDCGDDLSSINTTCYYDDLYYNSDLIPYDSEGCAVVDEQLVCEVSQRVSSMFVDHRAFLYGSDVDEVPNYWTQFGCMSIEAAYHSRNQYPADDCIDVIELFGGDGLTMFLAAKHHGLRTGVNFELMAGIDLSNEADVHYLFAYLRRNKPRVTIMAPPCRGYSKWGHLNRKINPEAWMESRKMSVPLARLSGDVALEQVDNGRHYLVEQPQGSGLFQEDCWMKLNERSHRTILDQCMVGLQMRKEPFWPVKKPTEIWCDDPTLTMYLQGLRCDGSHPHAHIGSWNESGHPTVKSSDMQVWPYELCARIAAGIEECIIQDEQKKQLSFPTAAEREKSTCPGCRNHLRKDDPKHDRGPKCLYRDVVPHVWECEACKIGRHRAHSTHTLDHTCRWAVAREVGEGASRERATKHPRDGRVPASVEPTAALRLEGRSDGVPGALEPTPKSVASVKRKTSVTSTAGKRRAEVAIQVDAPVRPPVEKVKDDDVGDEDEPSWSKHDLGFALQQLRSLREGIVRRTLRKLHIRWFHASSKRMMTLLEAAGVKKDVIQLVPQIVDTCVVCRNWQRPGPRSVTSTRVPDVFNKEVQIDLLYYKTRVILHCVDACTRWTAALGVDSREASAILDAFSHCWLGIFGPPEMVLTDQEGSLNTDEVAAWFENKGIKLCFRAREQHCSMVERHNEILRRQMHLIADQALEDGIDVSTGVVLREAVFAKNALFMVGNTTPYQAVFGRTPPLMAVVGEESGDPFSDRESNKVRQIAINSMIQATAEQKTRLAESTKTRRAGELLQLSVGDLIDFHRKPMNKDQSGWHGPAEVANLLSLCDGIVHIKWQGRVIPVRVGDVRRAMVFSVFMSRPSGPVRVLKEAVEHQTGVALRVGWFKQGSHWMPCNANQSHSEVLVAGLYVAAVCLQLEGVTGFRFGSDVNNLPAVTCDDTLLLWWFQYEIGEWYHSFTPGTKAIALTKHCGASQRDISFVQFFIDDHEAVKGLRKVVDDVAHLGGNYEPSMPNLRKWTELRSKSQRAVCDGVVDGEVCDDELAAAERSDAVVDDQVSIDAKSPKNLEVPTSENATVEDHEMVGFEFSYYSLTQSTKFCGSTFSSSPPAISHLMGELPEVLNDDRVNDDLPQLEFTNAFSVYVVVPDKPSGRRCADEHNMVFSYEVGKAPFAAIERVHNIITRQEALENLEACKESMLEEIGRWIKHKAWKRGPRSEAQNVLSSRWVLKWKDIGQGTEKKRRIKARLVAQGFRDRQEVENYAGTTSRWAQRVLVIVAVQQSWDLWSADISEAFLRGLTFEELHKDGVNELRRVELELPPGGEQLLRLVPGYGDFDPLSEVLVMLKPGFGLKDAPRLWLLALRRVLNSIGARPTCIDPQLYCIHDAEGRLALLMSIHVDDIKICGQPKLMQLVIQKLEESFDALKLEKNNFIHLGLQHVTNDDGSISISQEHYISELRTIPDEKLKVKNRDEDLDDEYQGYYRSLLGGLAWVSQTRMDAAVFIGALQRRLHKPTVGDVLNLNRVVNYVKSKPMRMTFRRLDQPWKIVAISDSGFKGEDQDHLAVRSGIICLVNKNFPTIGRNQLQIVEFVSRKQSHVCRSTFSAELLSCLDLCGLALNISMAMTEVLLGPKSATELTDGLNAGKLALETEVVIDAASVYDAIAAADVKCPSDVSMHIHIVKMKELLCNKQINRLRWVDTRCMLADGLNKGCIERDALQRAMTEGIWLIEHEMKVHEEKELDVTMRTLANDAT